MCLNMSEFTTVARILNTSCTIHSIRSLYRLTLSWRRSPSCRNQSIDLLSKSTDWFIHDRGLCHVMKWVLIERWAYSEPCQRSKKYPFGKIITAFKCFRITLHLKSLRGCWICVGFQICQGSEYSRIINMPVFWISRITKRLPILVNMAGFWICVEMQLWKRSKYSRILNIPSL